MLALILALLHMKYPHLIATSVDNLSIVKQSSDLIKYSMFGNDGELNGSKSDGSNCSSLHAIDNGFMSDGCENAVNRKLHEEVLAMRRELQELKVGQISKEEIQNILKQIKKSK